MNRRFVGFTEGQNDSKSVSTARDNDQSLRKKKTNLANLDARGPRYHGVSPAIFDALYRSNGASAPVPSDAANMAVCFKQW
jgi:hypothetical protein